MKKGSLLALLNPLGEAWKNMRRAKGSGLVEESNMNGDGLTLGGEDDAVHARSTHARRGPGVGCTGVAAGGVEYLLCLPAGAAEQILLDARQLAGWPRIARTPSLTATIPAPRLLQG